MKMFEFYSKKAMLLINKIWYTLRFFGKNIKVHPSSYISRRAVLSTVGGGRITIGRGCEIHSFAMIITCGGEVIFGDHCSLNPFSIAYGHGGLTVGNDVRIAAHTVIIPANHLTNEDKPIYQSGLEAKGIKISDHVWIGAGAKILDGVTVHASSVIGAGAVVTKDVLGGTTVVGVPGRPVRN